MATSAISGKGTTFSWDSTQVSEVNSVGDIEVSRDDIDATHYQSSDDYREYLPGLKDGGELTIEGNFLPSDTGQSNLLSDFNSDNTKSATITLPDNSTWTFDAYVKSFSTSNPMDEKVTFSATLKITGKPTFTA